MKTRHRLNGLAAFSLIALCVTIEVSPAGVRTISGLAQVGADGGSSFDQSVRPPITSTNYAYDFANVLTTPSGSLNKPYSSMSWSVGGGTSPTISAGGS